MQTNNNNIKKQAMQKTGVLLFAAVLFFVVACTPKVETKGTGTTALPVVTEQIIEPVDARHLELSPYDYITWLKENKGLTYNSLENDSVQLSIMYQPYTLQAAIGMQSTGMTYKDLLEIKKDYDYFFIDCLYKKISVVNKNKRSDFLKFVKNNIYVIKNNTDTLSNIPVEVFVSAIANKPDNIMVLVQKDYTASDLACVINNTAIQLNDLKIKIPSKQFELLPTLKLE